MTAAPFTFGKIDSVEDYDDVIDCLNTWQEKVTPLYLSSPEYKALSKASQRGKGEWFGVFMELNIGYKSTPLAKIDATDAREIMGCLFRRKLICSDAQVRANAPELIAFWQFLRRECGDKNMIRQTASETKMEKVSLDVVCALLPNFLAKHKESKLPIDVGLVQIFETLEIKDCPPPRSCRLETLLLAELLVDPEDAEIERVQKSSRQWTTSAIGWFWFDERVRPLHGPVLDLMAKMQETLSAVKF